MHNERWMKISKYIGEATNNIAEMRAMKEALLAIRQKPDIPVYVHTDSNYVIGMLSKNWKVKANKELVEETKSILAEFANVSFLKAKGHSGDVMNDIVDKLATSAITRKDTKVERG